MGPLHLSTYSMYGCTHGCTVVDIGGEVDIATAPHLRTYVGHLLDATGSDTDTDTDTGSGSGSGQLTLNLGAVTFMDARGLSALVAIRLHAGTATIPLLLAALPPPVRRLLRITRLDTSFVIVADAVHPADHPHTAGHSVATR